MAPDSIPGYDDLTPYGPGIVGKTIGPVLPPTPFVALVFLDTLISYKHQSVTLGWLKSKRDDDCDEDEKPDDGIVKNLDKRLDKAKKELIQRDSVKARNELEKFVKKVERLWKRSQLARPQSGRDEDNNDKRDKVVMTSEAYALLKFNTEYLIDRLPAKQTGKEKGKSDQ